MDSKKHFCTDKNNKYIACLSNDRIIEVFFVNKLNFEISIKFATKITFLNDEIINIRWDKLNKYDFHCFNKFLNQEKIKIEDDENAVLDFDSNLILLTSTKEVICITFFDQTKIMRIEDMKDYSFFNLNINDKESFMFFNETLTLCNKNFISNEIKTYKFPDITTNVSRFEYLKCFDKKTEFFILLGSSDLFLINVLNSVSSVTKLEKDDRSNAKVSSLIQSLYNPNFFFVLKESESIIHVYNIFDTKNFFLLSIPDEIKNMILVPLHHLTTEFLLIFTNNKIFVYDLKKLFNNDKTPQSLITIESSEPSDNNKFFNLIFFEESSKLLGVFHNHKTISFKEIFYDNFTKESINIFLNKNELLQEDKKIYYSSKNVINKFLNKNFFNLLEFYLDNHQIYSQKIIDFCSIIDDENIIKGFFITLNDENKSFLYIRLFEILCNDSNNFFENKNLSIWIKFLIICNGYYIFKESDQNLKIKELISEFENKKKLLPSLYGIKGKLSFLKNQTNSHIE